MRRGQPTTSASTRSGSRTTSASRSRSTAAARGVVRLRAAHHAGRPGPPGQAGPVSAPSCCARPCGRPGSLAKALTTLDRLCGGRLDIGLGAGWYAPDYDRPRPGPADSRRAAGPPGEALAVLDALLPGGPATVDGKLPPGPGGQQPASRPAGAPPPDLRGRQGRPAPRAGGPPGPTGGTPAGSGRPTTTGSGWPSSTGRARRLAATPPPSAGHSASTPWPARTERDLERRFERMRDLAPGGMLGGTTLEQWREGRLVGTAEELAEQVAGWEEPGVAELIVLGRAPAVLPQRDRRPGTGGQRTRSGRSGQG